jgi:hypothetical protein
MGLMLVLDASGINPERGRADPRRATGARTLTALTIATGCLDEAERYFI